MITINIARTSVYRQVFTQSWTVVENVPVAKSALKGKKNLLIQQSSDVPNSRIWLLFKIYKLVKLDA